MFTFSSVRVRGPTLSPLSPLSRFGRVISTQIKTKAWESWRRFLGANTEPDGVIIAVTEALLISIPAILATQFSGVQSMIMQPPSAAKSTPTQGPESLSNLPQDTQHFGWVPIPRQGLWSPEQNLEVMDIAEKVTLPPPLYDRISPSSDE